MRVFYIVYFISLTFFASAQEDIFVLDKQNKEYSVIRYFDILIDSTNSITFDRVINEKLSFPLKVFSDAYWHNFSSNKKYTYWLRLRVKNADTVNIASFQLESYRFEMAKVWFYYPNAKGGFQLDSMGFEMPFHTRKIKHKNPEIQLLLEQGKEACYYIKIISYGKLWPNFMVKPMEEYLSYSFIEYFRKGIFIGFFVFIFLLNCFFFVALREKSYLFYMLFVFFETLFIMPDGFGFQYFWPNYPLFNYYVIEFSRTGMVVSLLLFVVHFLTITSVSKNIFWSLMAISVVRILLYIPELTKNVIDKSAFEFTHVLDGGIVIGLFFVIGYLLIVTKKRFVLYFLVAHLFLTIGFINETLFYGETKLFPVFFEHFVSWVDQLFTGFFFYIFGMFHLMFVSVALVDRIKNLKSDNEKNQSMLIAQLEENKRIQVNLNQELEIKVKERTEELNQQKEEIIAQNEELQKQSHAIELQSTRINELYKEVTASIETAKFIQDSILPPAELINTHLPDHFVFYQPKDIVSGDFYWFYQVESKIYIAAVDCTGHGVAGAFMSLLGYNLLNQIIENNNSITAAEILNLLSQNLVKELHQDKAETMSKDGMDIALCIIEKNSSHIQFAGANNPLYIVRNEEVIQIKGDKFGIGLQYGRKDVAFTNHEIDVEKGDQFYIFSDGYAGQFGGDKKFLYTNFRDLLVKISLESMVVQRNLIEQTFIDWKGNTEQTDDILVIGFKV